MVFHCLKKKIKNEKVFNYNNYLCFGSYFWCISFKFLGCKNWVKSYNLNALDFYISYYVVLYGKKRF